jgi:hypothetical protein
MTSNQDDKQKELEIPMTGIEVMNYLSLDTIRMFHFAEERILLPHNQKDPLWIKLKARSRCDPPEHTLSRWIYLKSDVEDFKLKHKDLLEGVRQQKAFGLAESQKSSKLTSKYFSETGKKGGQKPKKNIPILLAIVKHLEEKPSRKENTNYQIAEGFKKKVKENSPIIVEYAGCEWDVFFKEEKISAVPDTKHNAHHYQEIAFSTFMNSYITEVKNIIKGESKHNQYVTVPECLK